MKPPSKIPFLKLTFSRNYDHSSSSLASLIPELCNPSRFNLLRGRVLLPPSLNQNTNKSDANHFHDSTNHPKSIIKIKCFDTSTPNNVCCRPHFLDSATKPKFVYKNFIGITLIATNPTQERLFSSSPSDSIPVSATANSPLENIPPIDAGSSIRKPVSLWPGMYHSPVTNALWEARTGIFERPTKSPENSPSQNELISKTPSESRTSILYKFSDDYILREQYRNPWNEIRMGKLLEDLDALAGTISFKHCSGDFSSTSPHLLVTASVDKMVLRKPIQIHTDVTIAGAVTWVGRSSLEIQLEVAQSTKETSNPSESVALTANFTFVARDSSTGKSAPVNQITRETEKEKLLWKEAEERNKLRKIKKGEQKAGINDEEVKRLNELLSEARVFCDMPALANPDSILIKDTCLQNSLMCQPQQRNIHGRIFGGFLMRRAFELAFATAYSFAGSAPCFVEVDHVDFVKPVDVGNFLRFKSCVLYTELENPSQPLINVEVVAHVMRPELRSSEVSNKFYFTFSVHSSLSNGQKIRKVVPSTEEEARRVMERMEAERCSL